MTTLNAQTTALLLIDVQERINGVMVDQSHLSRQKVLLEAFAALDLPAVTPNSTPRASAPPCRIWKTCSPRPPSKR